MHGRDGMPEHICPTFIIAPQWRQGKPLRRIWREKKKNG